MKRIYLCSRVAFEAREFNSQVAKAFRDAGFEVYVPHEQAPNNLTQSDMDAGRFDKETIFKLDYAAMDKADLCVVVGKIGRDCAWEIGHFEAWGIPIYFVPGTHSDWNTSPMLIPSLTFYPIITDPVDAAVNLAKAYRLDEETK